MSHVKRHYCLKDKNEITSQRNFRKNTREVFSNCQRRYCRHKNIAWILLLKRQKEITKCKITYFPLSRKSLALPGCSWWIQGNWIGSLRWRDSHVVAPAGEFPQRALCQMGRWGLTYQYPSPLCGSPMHGTWGPRCTWAWLLSWIFTLSIPSLFCTAWATPNYIPPKTDAEKPYEAPIKGAFPVVSSAA